MESGAKNYANEWIQQAYSKEFTLQIQFGIKKELASTQLRNSITANSE